MSKLFQNLFYFLFFTVSVHANTAVRDSLIKVFNNTDKEDTTKINLANDIAFEFARHKIKDSSEMFLNISKNLLEQIDYKKGQGTYYRINALHIYNNREVEKSIEEIEKSLAIFKEIANQKEISNSLNAYGLVLKDYGDYENALEKFEEAYEVALKNDYKNIQSSIINNIASILTNQGNRDKALEYYNKAIELDLELGNRHNLASVYTNLALMFQYQDNNDSALHYHYLSLNLFRELKEDSRLIGCLNNIGNIQRVRSNYIEALENFQEALGYAEKLDNVRLKAITLNNMGNIYFSINELENAIEKYQESAELLKTFDKNAYAGAISNVSMIYESQGKYDFALKLLQSALEIYEKQKFVPYMVSTYNNIGSNYFKTGKLDESLAAFLKAIELNKDNGSKYSSIYSHFGLAEIYFKQNKLKEAKKQATIAFDFASKINASKEISMCADLLYQINRDSKNYKDALSYFEIHKTISDSLLDNEKSRELGKLEAEIEYKNLTEKTKLENDKIFLEKEIKLSKQNSFLWIMSLSIVALIVVIILVLVLKRNREIANYKLLEEREKVNEQNKQLQDLHLQKNKLFSIIAHDLRGPLNTLSWFVEMASNSKLSRDEIDTLLPELNKSLSSTKILTENLLNWASKSMNEYNKVKENIHLHTLAENKKILFATSLENKKVNLINNIDENLSVYYDINALQLIFRNIISNAIKYCNEGDTITLSANLENKDYYKICISDTGIGMDELTANKLFTDSNISSNKGTDNEKGSGIGLMLCKNFVVENGGKIWVENTELGKGTKICFTIPKK